MKNILLFLWIFLWPVLCFSQENTKKSALCYTFGQLPKSTENALRVAQEKQSQVRNKGQESNLVASCSDYTIRVYFHIVRRTNGTGGQNASVISTIMTNFSTAFSAHNVSFINLGNDEVNDDNFYAFDDSKFNSLVYSGYSRSDAINVYLLDDAVYDGGRAIIGGNALVVGGRFNGTTPAQPLVPTLVVAHEMGHCLGLYHTFETVYGAERVDGSNCTNSGDLVCDTPAESPAYAFQENNSCAYTLSLTDAVGDTYAPDPHNIMNYVRPSCFINLSNGQGNRMRNTIGLGTGFANAVEATPVYAGGTYTYGTNTYAITGNSGISVSNSGPTIYFNLANYGRYTNYVWSFTYQSGSVSYSYSGRNATVTLAGGASINVICNYSNECGSGSVSFSCYNYSGGWRMAAYPNPANQDITVATIKSEEQNSGPSNDQNMGSDSPIQDNELVNIESSIRLLDKNNVVVQEGNLIEGKLNFSTSKLPSGTYYLQMNFEDKQIRKQIIIQH